MRWVWINVGCIFFVFKNIYLFFGKKGTVKDHAVGIAKVGTMVDDAFSKLLGVAAPVVADGGHGTVGIVVQGVSNPIITIVVQGVVTKIIFGAHIDAVVIDGCDAPQVAGNDVAAELGSAGGVVSIDTSDWFPNCCF